MRISKEIKKEIGLLVLATTIAIPLSLPISNYIIYHNTKSRLERLEKKDPSLAEEVAKNLARPAENYIEKIFGGNEKAANEFLARKYNIFE